MDGDLELDLDVLDDLAGEAAEVATHQPWLCYGEALHRLREWGTTARVLDLLDERPLAKAELPRLARLLLGDADLPHPDVDWRGFLAGLDRLQAAAGEPPRDPLTKRRRPWLDTRALNRAYGPPGGCAVA